MLWGAVVVAILLIIWGNFSHSYYEQNLALGAVAPSPEHWFGTDQLGRDLFARVSYASLVSLTIGILATLLAVAFGTGYGMISGYCGGSVDTLMMRVIDVLYPIPLTLIVILLTVIFHKHRGALLLAIGAVEWMTTARIIRSETLKIRTYGYIQFAKGIGNRRILWKHVWPNLKPLVTVCFLLTLPGTILLESFLSFIGLGIQPPKSSFGILISLGAKHMTTSPWEVIFPTLVFVAVILLLHIPSGKIRN